MLWKSETVKRQTPLNFLKFFGTAGKYLEMFQNPLKISSIRQKSEFGHGRNCCIPHCCSNDDPDYIPKLGFIKIPTMKGHNYVYGEKNVIDMEQNSEFSSLTIVKI